MMANRLRKALVEELERLGVTPADDLAEQRYRRLMAYGQFTDR
jgi:acetyl-CoA carboxylase alpha subunit